jgi:putative tricarboxylic transport membrane protein
MTGEDGAMPPAESNEQTRTARFPRDIGAGLFLLAIAAFGYAGAVDLPSIWEGVGSGLMPKLMAGLIAALGLLIAGFGFSPTAERLQRWTLRGPVFVLGSVVVFAATVRTLGLAAAGPLTWIIAALADKESRLFETIVFAFLMTALCIGLFKIVLKLPIPLFPVVLGY